LQINGSPPVSWIRRNFAACASSMIASHASRESAALTLGLESA